jgi:DNA-binding phage protein
LVSPANHQWSAFVSGWCQRRYSPLIYHQGASYLYGIHRLCNSHGRAFGASDYVHEWEPKRTFMVLTAYFDENGTHAGADVAQFVRVRELLNQGFGISAVAKSVGLKRQSVYRIRSEPQKQIAALRLWYPEDFEQLTFDQTHVAQ